MAKQLVRPRVYMETGLIVADSRRLRRRQNLSETYIIKRLSKVPIELVLLSEHNKRTIELSKHIAQMIKGSWIMTVAKDFEGDEKNVRWHVPAIDADQAESLSPFIWVARNITQAESTRVLDDYKDGPGRLILGAHPAKGLDEVALFHMNSFAIRHPAVPASALPDLRSAG